MTIDNIFYFRLHQNEQINQVSVRRIEDSPEAGDGADLVVFTVMDIFLDIDLECEVEECIGRPDQGISGHLCIWVRTFYHFEIQASC